jgi:glyoxylase-like metal-dependent hydrolase (beta-lactamase superfamily II)
MPLLDRRTALTALSASAMLAAVPRLATAAAPLAGTQVPGLRRLKIGGIEVTALLDGHLPIPHELFPGAAADPATANRLTDEAFLPRGPVTTPVNAFLVNTGPRLVLVDTGTANLMGPGLGRLAAHLTAAGVRPEQVDAVLLTHVHPDHFGGLVADGRPVFQNAEVLVPEADHAFWTDEGIASRAPADFQPFFAAARATIRACGDKVRRFAPGGEVAPGVTSIAAPGHTVGHTAYRIASGNEQLLIWGDVVHVAPFQFAQPDWSIAFDTDQDQARATRRRLLDLVATDRVQVAGAHLPFPGFGHVARAGNGYAFVPTPWLPL